MELLENTVENIILEIFLGDNKKANKYLQNREKFKRKKILLLQVIRYSYKSYNRIPKVSNYVDTIENFSNETFHSHFRMSRAAFMTFLELLESKERRVSIGRPQTQLKHRLYITLWTLANQNTFREIGDRFDMSKGTVYYIVINTCRTICSLLNKFVVWPTTHEQINKIVEEFNHLRGNESFPNVLGCIDGMHIAIPAPSKDQSSYYNRKGFHSLILQAVCNAQGVFTNVFFGWPGRSHDAWVFKRSMLGKKLINGSMKIPADVHIIGDSAYPLAQYLMVPYRDNGNLNETQRMFNYRLSSTRVLIEQSFGILKSKFRVLNSIQLKKLSEIKNIVLACIILHNFIILDGDDTLNLQHVNENQPEESQRDESFPISTEEAKTKRDNLCNLMYA